MTFVHNCDRIHPNNSNDRHDASQKQLRRCLHWRPGPFCWKPSQGAGFGATTVDLKGGLGSASAVTREGHTVGAVAAVNACGIVNVGRGPHFWAALFELDGEFGGLGFPHTIPPDVLTPRAKGQPGENTTIAIVATDAALSKAQTKQLAIMAQDGFARAIYPAHTTLDGDTVFAVAIGRRPLPAIRALEGATASLSHRSMLR